MSYPVYEVDIDGDIFGNRELMKLLANELGERGFTILTYEEDELTVNPSEKGQLLEYLTTGKYPNMNPDDKIVAITKQYSALTGHGVSGVLLKFGKNANFYNGEIIREGIQYCVKRSQDIYELNIKNATYIGSHSQPRDVNGFVRKVYDNIPDLVQGIKESLEGL